MDVQPAADVLRSFLAECEVKLVHFAPQNISNMLWACATLIVSPGKLLCHKQQLQNSSSRLETTGLFRKFLLALTSPIDIVCQ